MIMGYTVQHGMEEFQNLTVIDFKVTYKQLVAGAHVCV